MNGLAIVEWGLKTIVFLLDLGFLLCFVLFQAGTWMEVKRISKARDDPTEKHDGSCVILFFVLSIMSILVSVVLSGLVLMPWWT